MSLNMVKVCLNQIFLLFKRKELATTEIEDMAMATDAKIGFIKILKNGYNAPMATGMRIML